MSGNNQPRPPLRPQLVVGTAGHIDHGKSRLVWKLTGTDPDRLPEEKARGMTIDLGFAHCEIDGCDVWFVDVPGHERFLRNMVAGASGVDAALLVVAADDSVMPQTREHAEVLSLLAVRRCLVVLTKMDLVDEAWADAVEQDARGLLASLGMEPVGVVRTSAESGRGLDELRALLADLARGAGRSADYTWFRLPIDRAFSVPGRGTVVTGSVAHGSIRSEDELELWPAGRLVRVRDIQSHSEQRQDASGRMRLAVNLAGLSLTDVRRGCELASPGCLEATQCLDVHLLALRMPGKTPRKTRRLRLHIGTSEVLAQLRLLDGPHPPEGTQHDPPRFGQLRVAEPIVAAWGQRFILRDESGMKTLGGGQVLRPVASAWTSRNPANPDGLALLTSGKSKARLEEAVRAYRWQPCGPAQLATRAGLPDSIAVTQLVRQLAGEGRLVALAEGTWLHASLLAEAAADIAGRLARFLDANPRLPGVPRGEWNAWMPRACPARLRPALAEHLLANGTIQLNGAYIVPAGHAAAMSAEDQALLAAMLDEFHSAAFQPPAFAELKCRTPRNEKRLRELVDLAAARGTLVRVTDGLWLHQARWQELIRRVCESVRVRGPLTVADVRTLLNSTRKYVVPICEFMDAAGLTRRSGDQRQLGPRAEALLGACNPIPAETN